MKTFGGCCVRVLDLSFWFVDEDLRGNDVSDSLAKMVLLSLKAQDMKTTYGSVAYEVSDCNAQRTCSVNVTLTFDMEIVGDIFLSFFLMQ